MKKMTLAALAVSAVMLMVAMVGLAQADTIVLQSDANTLGAVQGDVGKLNAGDASGLTFSPVIVDALGTNTPIPPGAPTATAVVNIPPGSGQWGFFKMTFTLPSTYSGISLSGAGNVDDVGTFFLNGTALTPINGLSEFGNVTFTTANSSLFHAGENIILISDANTGGGPSGGAFFVNVSYAPVPVPGTLLLLGSGLLGLSGWRRFRKG